MSATISGVRRYGERGWLVEVDDPADVPPMQRTLAGLAGVAEAVAGARTVLVLARPGAAGAVREAIPAAAPAAGAATRPEPVELPVRYDGADLGEVAALAGLSVAEVVARHQAPSYVVRFCGFSPGFAYLDGLDERLHVPRRTDPRTLVPAGSVGVAGEFSGVYPRASPGGWRLLGHTGARLWDLDRDPPALLVPGTPVRFVAV